MRYMPMSGAHTADFPVSYLYEDFLEPQSSPIVEMHAHDVLELGYCHSGSGILAVEDRVAHFSAGDISVLREGQMHMSRSANDQPSRWSYFWLDAGRLLAGMPEALSTFASDDLNSPSFPSIFSRRRYEKLCLMMRDMVEELSAKADGHRIVVKGLACAFVAMLHRVCRDMPKAEAAPRRHGMERIAPALYYMAGHYAEPIEPDDLAAMCSTSIRSFRRLFQTAMGKPPLQYLSEFRARMAAAILSETEKPISLIAYEVGFESINTFNRQFRATMGAAPSQWRRTHGRQ